MTTPEPPEWARAVPSTDAVRLPPNPLPATRPLTPGQLIAIGGELIEQFIRRVVLAVVGFFIPNQGAAQQLADWAGDIAQGISDALAGLADLIGKLLAVPGQVIGSIVNVVMDGISTIGDFLSGLWNAFTGQNQTGRTAVQVSTAAAGVTSTANTAGANATAAQNTANLGLNLTNQISRAGSNIVVGPDFEDASIQRIPFGAASSGYSTEQFHGGVRSWKWTQAASTAAGVYLAPNTTFSQVLVQPGDVYQVDAWIFPAAGNTGVGSLEIGALISDSTGANSPTSITSSVAAEDVPLSAWSKLSTSLTVPAGYDTAQFLVRATGTTPAGNVFYVDDVLVREVTDARHAQENASLAQSTADTLQAFWSTPRLVPPWMSNLTDDVSFAQTLIDGSTAPSLNQLVLIPVLVTQDRVYDAIKFGLSANAMTTCTVGLYSVDKVTGAGTLVVGPIAAKPSLDITYNVQTVPLPQTVSVQRGELYYIGVLQIGGTASAMHRWSSATNFTTGQFPRFIGMVHNTGGLTSLPASFTTSNVISGTKFWGALGLQGQPLAPGSAFYSDSFNRANAGDLGPSWILRYNQGTNSALQIIGNAAGLGSGTSTAAAGLSAYVSRMATTEQEVGITLGYTIGSRGEVIGGRFGVIGLRGNGSGSFVYATVRLTRTVSGGSTTFATTCTIRQAGSYNIGIDLLGGTQRASFSNTNNSLHAPGTWSLRALLNVYALQYNGATVATWTDGGPLFSYGNTSTEVLMGTAKENSSAVVPAVDNWYAKDL